MATDRIKVSQLPLINSGSLSINDVFIINDSDRGDGQTITSGIKYADVIGSLSQQDINFTGDITFTGDVLFNGSISPSPGKELNLTLDNLTINDSITIDPSADISGIKLSDLDDTLIVSQVGNQLLIWDQGEQAWRNFTLQQIIDFAPEISFENVTDIDMSGDLTVGGDLSVSGNISGIGLNDLDDVRTPAPITDRRFLRWDQTTQQWIPSTVEATDIVGNLPGGGDPDNVQSLNDLNDVNVPNPSNGNVLVYDATTGNWISGESQSTVVVADSANRPQSPVDGSLWFNTDEGILFVWDEDNENWVDVRPGPDSIIKAQGYNVPGGIRIEDLQSSVSVSPNDQFIIEQSTQSGKVTRSASWSEIVAPLLNRIEELERRLG